LNFELLSALEEEWKPVSRLEQIGWLGFFALFLVYALFKRGDGLFIDLVFLPIHEGGHLLFGWFGEWPGVLGGTLLQFGVPAALALYFAFQRHLPATALCAYFFFENFLPASYYMADSLKQERDYVTVGGGEAIHDWFFVFHNLGMLGYHETVARLARAVGWFGMVATMAWFVKRSRVA
jgi:hypothetical protein